MKDFDIILTINVPAENSYDAQLKVKKYIDRLTFMPFEQKLEIKEQGEWID